MIQFGGRLETLTVNLWYVMYTYVFVVQLLKRQIYAAHIQSIYLTCGALVFFLFLFQWNIICEWWQLLVKISCKFKIDNALLICVNIKLNFSQNRIQLTLKHLQKHIFLVLLKLCQSISWSPDVSVKIKRAKQDTGLY